MKYNAKEQECLHLQATLEKHDVQVSNLKKIEQQLATTQSMLKAKDEQYLRTALEDKQKTEDLKKQKGENAILIHEKATATKEIIRLTSEITDVSSPLVIACTQSIRNT